jgi:DNA-binding transcriptional MerR regulator
MTNGDRLTLAELAGTVGMTARNVRAYQTRGLLQPPLRVGRSSVYGAEHVRRLLQVQRARARGASLALLQTLIAEGRDLEGVWSEQGHAAGAVGAGSVGAAGAAGRPVDPAELADVGVDVIDVSDATLGHTADCLARREVPLASLLSRLAADADAELRASVQALVDAGVFIAGDGDGDGELRVPGSFACAVAALHDQGSLATAAAIRLASSLTEAARAVVVLVATTARTIDISVDSEARRAAAARLGELAAAVVGQLAGRAVLAGDGWADETVTGDLRAGSDRG